MTPEELKKLVLIRTELIKDFQKRKDWKSNRNAIMREMEHVELLEKTIKQIDLVLKDHVTFS